MKTKKKKKKKKHRSKMKKKGEQKEWHTEWLRNPAIGIKHVLSFPSGNITCILFEYQSSQAHKNCSQVYTSRGNISG